MATLSWEEIVERGKQHNKTVICEVEKRRENGDRVFRLACNNCLDEKLKTTYEFKLNCSKCFPKYNKSNAEEFILKAKKIHGNIFNYDLVEYINCSTKIKLICTICDNIFLQSPNNHLSGKKCKTCSENKFRSNNDDFILKAIKIHGNKYNYDSSDYINNRTKVKILCNICKTNFFQKPSNHLSNQGCPKCNESKGENRVAKYLSDNNISFIPQKIFKTLKDKSYLKPDFYLTSDNLLIEYDGEGHYFPCFGSTPEQKQNNLEDTQRRDKIKDDWAKANNIPLLRIPYWDFDRIEELVEAFILKHTKKEMKQLSLEM